MKILKINFIIIFLVISSLNKIICQPQWQWQNPTPQGNNLYTVFFVNDSVGFSAGNLGTILKTRDRGETWDIFHSGQSDKIVDIFFINENNGYAIGGKEIILKTLNGGDNWELLYLNTDNWLRNVIFTSNDTGFVVGHFNYILYTFNGGESWENYYLVDDNSYLADIYFINQHIGYCLSMDGKIFKTTNGGLNWNHISQISSNWMYNLKFYNEHIGCATGINGHIAITTDGGNSWDEEQISNYIDELFLEIFFVDSSTLFLLGRDVYNGPHHLFRSYDLSDTWLVQNVSDFYSMYFFNDTLGYGVGGLGIIDRIEINIPYIDWIHLSNSITNYFTKITFPNDLVGFACGEDIFKTTDGGNNWISQNIDPPYNHKLNDILFVNDSTGFAVGQNGLLMQTNNGGDDWSYDDMGYPDLNAIFIVNDQIGYIVGNSSTIIKTTNGGISWTSTDLGSYDFNDVFFLTENLGFIGTEYGTIFKTVDGGINWNQYGTPAMYDLRAIFFPSELVGYGAGFGDIVKTEDGGETWFFLNHDLQYPQFYDVYFEDENHGLVLGSAPFQDQGAALITNDGGVTWNNYPVPMQGWAKGITKTLNNDFYICGNYGQLLKSENLFEFLSINIDNPNIDQLPQNLFIKQNYPNPFNPVTTISYQLPKSEFVNLSIYNVSGQLVETLANENKDAGYHSVQWDASGVSSGLYFYRIKVGEYSSTKKCLLLK